MCSLDIGLFLAPPSLICLFAQLDDKAKAVEPTDYEYFAGVSNKTGWSVPRTSVTPTQVINE